MEDVRVIKFHKCLSQNNRSAGFRVPRVLLCWPFDAVRISWLTDSATRIDVIISISCKGRLELNFAQFLSIYHSNA